MEIDLNRVLQIARRWWWLLILAPLIGGLTAGMVSSRQPEMYASDVTLLVSAGVSTDNAGSVQASQNLTETYSQWAVTRPVLERAVESLAYAGGIDGLSNVVSAHTVPDTLFIKITARDNDPREAARIANTVADRFLIDIQEQTNAQNAQVRSNIELQIEESSDRLAEVQERIGVLQAKDNRTVTDDQDLASLLNEESQLQAELAQQRATIRAIDVELASAQTRIVILSPASPPSTPYAPNTVRSTVIGVAAGVALAFAAVIVLEYLDDIIRDREELGRIANAPVLAGIGTAPHLIRGNNRLFVLEDPSSASAEAMRLLRANLEFASAPGRLTSLAISSPQREEGKSTLTANLGVVLAQTGLRTMIIDADLRKPAQHTIFGVQNRHGLSSLLVTPEPNWREGLTGLSIPNLALIPSGPIPPNPADLLSLDRFGALLEGVKEWADVVLIDTPPMLAASDALIVATRANATLLVCRHGSTRRGALRRATAAMSQAHIRLIGVVLNRTKVDNIDHYGRYASADRESRPRASHYFGGKVAARLKPTPKDA